MMIPVVCHADGFRFKVASVTPNLRCVTCGSDDLDLDDAPAPKRPRKASWDDGPFAWERQEARDAQMFADDYDDDRPTLAELEAEEAEWEARGGIESRRKRARFETDLPMGLVDEYQPEMGLLNETTSVTQNVRCSTCFYEGKIATSGPLPPCDNCGANTLSVAGNTLARRKTGVIQVRQTNYRGKDGWSIVGTGPSGRRVKVFTEDEAQARRIAEGIRAGDDEVVSREFGSGNLARRKTKKKVKKQASTPQDVLEHIQSRDPDGGNVYPTEEMYARFEQLVRQTHGDQAWSDYKGWGRDEDSPYDPSYDDAIPGAAFHAAARENVAHKVAEIAQGVLKTNPGMSKALALKVARQTVSRYPKVAGRKTLGYDSFPDDPERRDDFERAMEDGKNAYHAGLPRRFTEIPPYGEVGSPSSKAWMNRGTGWYAGWDQANLSDTSWEASKKTADLSPEEHGIKVGDFFYNSWGYDQTNIDFYKVVGVTAASVRLQAVQKQTVRSSPPADHVVPTDVPIDLHYRTSGPFIARLVSGGDKPAVSSPKHIYGGGYAWKWNGQPKYETSSGWGH